MAFSVVFGVAFGVALNALDPRRDLVFAVVFGVLGGLAARRLISLTTASWEGSSIALGSIGGALRPTLHEGELSWLCAAGCKTATGNGKSAV